MNGCRQRVAQFCTAHTALTYVSERLHIIEPTRLLLQPWVFCADLSGGEEAIPVPAIIDRPADLLDAAPQRRPCAAAPLVPRVLPPHFVYEVRGYNHMTRAARAHLDKLYPRQEAPSAADAAAPSASGSASAAPEGTAAGADAAGAAPADMWSGCQHTCVASGVLASFSSSARHGGGTHFSRAPQDRTQLRVRNVFCHTPIMECMCDCGCPLRRCVAAAADADEHCVGHVHCLAYTGALAQQKQACYTVA
jgi:hypothetical protein